jgi:hypothetical protein
VAVDGEAGQLTMVWRTSLPLKRNIFEVKQVVAGQMSRAWWRSVETGKAYYPSLGQLAKTPPSRVDVIE